MLDSLRPALVVTRREVRDQFRDWRIIIPIIILTVFFPSLMNFTAERVVDFVESRGAAVIGERLVPFLFMVVGFFPISVSLVIALESFAGEKERGSIEPLLATPLSDWQLYVGKLLAVMVPPLLASYLGIGVYLIGVYRDIGWLPELDLFVQIVALTTVQALVMVSAAVVISTQTTSVRAANLLASFIIVPVALLIQGESLVMFWGQYDALWWVVLALTIVAGLLVRTGIGHFSREGLLGRELDVLNAKWLWQIFVDEFKGEADSVFRWFKVELRTALGRLLPPVLLLTGLTVAALFVGASQASRFVIPAEVVQLEPLDASVFEGIEEARLFSARGIPIIWYHNLRAIVLAMLAGVFSYGVLGILILMMPIVLIGFFMATLGSAGVSMGTFLGGFVLPHGIFEVPAIILAGAALLRMGASMAAQSKGKTIGESLLRSLADWAKIMLGLVAPLLLLAAVMETLVTPRIAMWLLMR